MAMIDVGIELEISTEIDSTTGKPIAWRLLKDCSAMPALIQPSAKVATNFIGDEFTGEMLGKRAIVGLDFTFAYDGGKTGSQFRLLSDFDDNNIRQFLRVTYPSAQGEARGTIFELFVECEVTLVPPTPSGQLEYTLSVTPHRNSLLSDLIEVVYPEEEDPLEVTPPAGGSGE